MNHSCLKAEQGRTIGVCFAISLTLANVSRVLLFLIEAIRLRRFLLVFMAGNQRFPIQKRICRVNPVLFEGQQRNSIGFSSDLPWPDIGTKGAPDKAPWYCSYVFAADLGNNYGHSILAVGQHHSQHPCCVSIIDPENGTKHVSFWHWGHITKLWVIKGFFGKEKPAIIAKGVNTINSTDSMVQILKSTKCALNGISSPAL